MADAALWCGTHLRAVGAGVHGRIVSVRRGLEPVVDGGVPGDSGRGLRADDSWFAGAAAAFVWPGARRYRTGDLVDNHAGGAGCRSGTRRLHLRRLELAVDLLHQRADRSDIRIYLLAVSGQARHTDAPVADRHRGVGTADAVGGCAAGDAR